MKRLVLLTLIAFSFIDSFSQKLDTKYYFFSNDTLMTDHYLTFKNDSIVEISSVPRHMWKYMIQDFKYEKFNEKIVIHNDTSLLLDNYGFSENKELTIQGNGLVNEIRKEIYVKRKDFKKTPKITMILGGKKYKVDMGETNSYGLVVKHGRKNWRLNRKLKKIRWNEYEINVIKGYEAYKKYGYNYVFGVIEYNKRQ